MRRRRFSALGLGSNFGDLAIVAFLLTQAADGVLTYVGAATHGTWIEANPLIATLIGAVGTGPALAGVKLFAGSLGMLLHLTGVNIALVALTGVYLVAAIVPWAAILFM